MPIQGITFQGGFISLPGAYYADDVTAVGLQNPPLTPPLIFLGYGFGPKPKTPITFTNPQDLANALRGGPAAAFVPFLSLPSPQFTGAQYITFIDVSSNTQSTLTLNNSGATASLVLTSALYGPPSNLLKASVTAGSVSGVNLTFTDNYANTQISGLNLGYPMSIAYLGAASGGLSAAVSATGVVLTSPNASESITVPVGSGGYSLVSQVVAVLNGSSYWGGQVISSTNGTLPASGLTPGVYTLSPSGATPVYVPVPAYLNDPAFWVNNYAQAFCTAVASGTNVAGNLPAVAAAKFFTGAQGVPPVTADYASGFNVALTKPGWVVFADSNAAAVRALGAQHAQTASTPPYGMWRRFFTGSALGEASGTAVTNASVLNAKEVVYAYPGLIRSDVSTGLPTIYSGLYAAAAAAGIAAGAPVNVALTNKTLQGSGIEQTLNQSQMTNLQNNGVMVIFSPQAVPVPTILSDITTWQADGNIENISSQQVACRFWLGYTVVNALRNWVGTIASPIQEVALLKDLIRALNACIYTGGSNPGVLASWDRATLKLVYTGANQLAAVSFNATLVGQNKYITCFVPIQPLNITVTAAAIANA